MSLNFLRKSSQLPSAAIICQPPSKTYEIARVSARVLESANRAPRIHRKQNQLLYPPLTAKRHPEAESQPPGAGAKSFPFLSSEQGRLGTALAIALDKAGYPIRLSRRQTRGQCETRCQTSGRPGCWPLSAKQFRELAPRHRELLEQTSLIVIATPDDVD